MAEASIPLPKFQDSETHGAVMWREYKEDIDIHLLATGKEGVADKQKIAILLSGMPSKYKRTKKNFQYDDPGDADKYDIVLAKFDKHFEPKTVLKLEICKFDEMKQAANETVSDFVTRLREQATYCNFGTTLNTQLSKQVSRGVRSQTLRDKLWSEDLTLDQILQKCYLHEQRQGSKDVLESQGQKKEVNAMTRRGQSRSRGRNYRRTDRQDKPEDRRHDRSNQPQERNSHDRSNQPQERNSFRGRSKSRGRQVNFRTRDSQSQRTCGYCGSTHPPRRCPAYNAVCTFCRKPGHFSSVCRKKNVHSVNSVNFCDFDEYDENDDNDYGDDFDLVPNFESMNIYSIGVNDVSEADTWSVILKTPYENGKGAVKMHIDTQAQCNVLCLKTFTRMAEKSSIKLLRSNSTIGAFGNSTVKPVGQTTFEIVQKNGKIYALTCEVVEGDVPNILSAIDSQRLGFVKRVYANKVKRNVVKVTNAKDVNVPKSDRSDKVQSAVQQIVNEFSDRFPDDGIGKIPGKWSLHLDPDYKDGPIAHGPRPLPAALQEKTKNQLDYLEKHGIITKVPKGTPTPWCSQLHVVHKKDGKSVRICIDPKFLNRALLREYHPLNTLEQVLTKTNGSQYFTKLDANMGYYQLQLDYDSQLLTAFHTPWGRYMYQRLPMGIKSAPELFQRAMEEVLAGIDNVSVIFDDILIHTSNLTQHKAVLKQVLERARQNSMTFRLSKCLFAQSEVEYVGHILTPSGVKPAPDKVQPILAMSYPKSKEELRTFLGMATYLSKYIQNFSQLTEPLRQVLKQNRDKSGRIDSFHFGPDQIKAFDQLKECLATAPVMRYYAQDEPIILSCDASSYGLGSVILQSGQPVAYGSKSLTNTERAYAQIEKELLAIVFGCRKFHYLLYGRSFEVETDHLPLLRIFEKPLSQIPLRLQKMILKLQPYNFKLVSKSGKEIPVADALSRAPINDELPGLVDDMADLQVCALEVRTIASFSQEKLQELQETVRNDETLQLLSDVVRTGWPLERNQLNELLRPFWDSREEISIYDGILFKGERVIIPAAMQNHMLKLLHTSHQGMVKTKQLARDSLFWPGMNKQIEEIISKCSVCQAARAQQQKEPMLSFEVPKLPYQMVSSDLFDIDGDMYLATFDHYSGYLDVDELKKNSSSHAVIQVLKRIFAQHGIPQILVTDNGPQFSSNEFANFAKTWDFVHKTVSARYPQANGMAEKGVQIAKRLWMKAKEDKVDPYFALLDYRNTPRSSTLGSPTQRLMSRRTRTRIPVSNTLLLPNVLPPDRISHALTNARNVSKTYYDQHSKPLPELKMNDTVRVRKDKEWIPGKLVSKADRPRSYNVLTPAGQMITRNRRHLLRTNEDDRFDVTRRRVQSEMEDYDLIVPARQENRIRRQSDTNQNIVSQIPDGSCSIVNGPGANQNDVSSNDVVQPNTRTTRPQRVRKLPNKFKDFELS